MTYDKDHINKLKNKLDAVILAHNYQPAAIQDVADFCGDSLELSKKAAVTPEPVIVFCGVDFMAETAKILSPEKKVIIPDRTASCPMAEMITSADIKELRQQHPSAEVVCYVNTSAEVKAESDICCTSSNAVDIVKTLGDREVIFIPDRNLGRFVEKQTGKKMILWPGFCVVHDSIKPEEVSKTKALNPRAPVLVHPECRPEVIALADYAVSTGQMFSVVSEHDSESFIIGTEEGMLYALKKRFPDRKFIPAAPNTVCRNMKKTTIDKLVSALSGVSEEVSLDSGIIEKARLSLDRMLRAL